MNNTGLMASLSTADQAVEKLKANYAIESGVMVIPCDGDLRDILAEYFCSAREDALNERASEITRYIEKSVADSTQAAL